MAKHFKVLIVVFLAILSVSCGSNYATDSSWSYSGSTGPSYWGTIPGYELCGTGRSQSPVNIDTTQVVPGNVPNIVFHYAPTELVIENNGHTIEVEPHTNSYITINHVNYTLVQFHFHATSEHTINDASFPIEAHFVHQSSTGNLAVIGVLIEVGDENTNYNPIWDNLPTTDGEEIHLTSLVDLTTLYPDSFARYQYTGSLTTPPCSQGVQWFVLSTPTTMSVSQIAAFTAIYDHNFRPVQALNGRSILFDQ